MNAATEGARKGKGNKQKRKSEDTERLRGAAFRCAELRESNCKKMQGARGTGRRGETEESTPRGVINGGGERTGDTSGERRGKNGG